MHFLFWPERTLQDRRHDLRMLGDIAVFAGVRVTRFPYINITVTTPEPALSLIEWDEFLTFS
jgi:hypothetical protein